MITIGGFFSGLDTQNIIEQIDAANRIPITRLEAEKLDLDAQSSAFGFIGSSLSSLQSNLSALNDPNLFRTRSVTSSEASVGTASVSTSAATNSINLEITQVATASILRGGDSGGSFTDTKVTSPPAISDLLSDVLDEDVDGTTFTINGVQITLSSTDVINDINPLDENSVIEKINNSGAGVTASYDSATGKFSLSSVDPIILGSGSDTSSFLEKAQLFNNGTGSVESTIGIGRINPSEDLSTAGLRTTPTTGTFSVNGVDISYSSGDTLDQVLSRITDSDAGVVATYDAYADRVILTSKNRGAQGISVQDGTSNLGTALRLTSADSELELGKATLFKVGDDPTVRQSEDQTLTSDELGVTGLTFNASAVGTTTLDIQPDTSGIKKTIDEFIEQYNSAQNLIESYIQVNPDNLDENGILANDTSLTFLPSSLRTIAGSQFSGNETIRMLEDLGIVGNSNDNTITLSDESKLTTALSENLDEVIDLFTDSSSGLVTQLDELLESYNSSLDGIIQTRQDSIVSEQSRIDNEIDLIEARVEAERLFLESQFAILEQAEGQNQNLAQLFNQSTG